MFFDGHADLHPLVAARRASWGIAMLDSDGRTRATVYGVVPGALPQTAQAAEHIAFAVLVQLATGPSKATGDCS